MDKDGGGNEANMSLFKQILVVAVLCGAGYLGYLLVWPAINSADSVETDRSGARWDVPVTTTEAELKAERTRIEAVGTAEAIRSADLYAEASGQVVALAISPNKAVQSGDILLELDSETESLAVELAELKVQDARQLLARYERTAGTGAVPASTIDQARIALQTAEVELRQAQLDLAERLVLAPFDGYVGMTEIEVGDRIDENDLITTLDDREQLRVSFEIPENFLGRLSVGQHISVATWAARADAVTGEIVDINSRVDPVSRSFMVRAQVPNDEDRLRPGMSFAVTIDLLGGDYILAPEVAVQWGGDGAYLWVIRDGKAERVLVTIVQRQEGTVLVDAPVQPGEAIVVEGIQRMRDGLEVVVKGETAGSG